MRVNGFLLDDGARWLGVLEADFVVFFHFTSSYDTLEYSKDMADSQSSIWTVAEWRLTWRASKI